MIRTLLFALHEKASGPMQNLGKPLFNQRERKSRFVSGNPRMYKPRTNGSAMPRRRLNGGRGVCGFGLNDVFYFDGFASFEGTGEAKNLTESAISTSKGC